MKNIIEQPSEQVCTAQSLSENELIVQEVKTVKLAEQSGNSALATYEQPIAYEDLSRRDIRSVIFHLLYIAEMNEYQESLQSIVDNFCDGYNIVIPRHSEVYATTQQVITQKDALDEQYEPLLSNWRMDRISVCTKLILRFALWEIEHGDIDSRIVINEAIELAKCFAETDAHKFINGILDKVIKS